jgi:ankyrin repeat protein
MTERSPASVMDASSVQDGDYIERPFELMMLVETGRAADVIRALSDQPERIHIRDRSSNTLLHLAIASGSEPISRILLARGADINAVNCRGVSALHLARLLNRPSLIQMLLENGATPTLPQLEPLAYCSLALLSSL